MELKYYLRGLGLGIVVTAIIMGAAASGKRSMTDAEIIARARQLGMIEGLPLTESVSGEKDAADESEKNNGNKDNVPDARQDISPEQNADAGQDTDLGQNTDLDGTAPEEEDGGLMQPSGTEADASSDMQTARPGDEETAVPDQTQPEEEEPLQMPEAQETASSQEVMAPADHPLVVTIGSGDGSYEVSRKLADIGAVSSAEAYDTYLCENGYDKRIRTGAHTIPAGASEGQIARIITGME